jgi:hypothetical protein
VPAFGARNARAFPRNGPARSATVDDSYGVAVYRQAVQAGGSMTALLILVNPVGFDMLKATEYPAALFGPTLADDNRRRSTTKIM